MIQEEYQNAIKEALSLAKYNFINRLAAFYVGGSVALGEAWPGISDVDAYVVINGNATDNDLYWKTRSESSLKERFPEIANDFHFTLLPTEMLKTETCLYKFFLKYASERIYGDDIISQMEKDGFVTPKPSRELAISRFAFMENNIRTILDGKFPKTLGSLPDSDHFAVRKLARCLIFDSAWLLIACDNFNSFRASDVLASLKIKFPEWSDIYISIETALESPLKAPISTQDFIKLIQNYYLWLLDSFHQQKSQEEKRKR